LPEQATNTPLAFASLVNRHLYDCNLTQAWLAQQVGYANSSLSRIMRGHHKPNADLALAISEALDLTEEEKQELLATVPSRQRAAKEGASGSSGAVLSGPIRVQRPQPSPQRQIFDAQLRQLKQDLAGLKGKAFDLAAEIAALEKRVDEMEEKK
jgi:transcriptional regulator with XRE-family HTH domain